MIIQYNNTQSKLTKLHESLEEVKIEFNVDKIVNDEIRGYLEYKDNQWQFFHTKSLPFTMLKRKLALLLESPDKSEYDIFYNPLRPANGSTGRNIINKITTRAWISKLNQNHVIELYIMNPVRYQTSCYHELSRLTNNTTITKDLFSELTDWHRKKVKEIVWCDLFTKLEKNYFVSRIESYNPHYVVNSCSKSATANDIKTIVDETINHANIMNLEHLVEDAHPSYW